MPAFLPAVAVLLPFAGGVISYFMRKRLAAFKKPFVIGITALTSAFVWLCVFFSRGSDVTLFYFTDTLRVGLCPDGIGLFFAALASVMWIFTVIYAFEYMKGKEHLNMFFAFFTAAYGATLGIAMSADLLTMYFFYEILTLVTLPLVIQPMTKKAIRAGRKYLYMSLGGSAFAFIGLVILIHQTGQAEFVSGGIYDNALDTTGLVAYLLTFLGFGVKSAVFPLHIWLPAASVAPTPVTALLHAVAVVKSGVFAIIRVTYYCYGVEAIRGTWAQYTALIIAIITIVYGSAMALRERHFKRRLAYSTVSNISYIVFGAMLLSEAGLAAALMHFLFHSVTKIAAFMNAGAVIETTEREYIFRLDGLGRKMPVTFGCFTVSALSLTGIPLFCGFFSKWNLCTAALADGGAYGIVGVAALLISALFTAIYMFSIVIRAFFRQGEDLEDVHEANWRMSWIALPLALFMALAFILMPQLSQYFNSIASAAFAA